MDLAEDTYPPSPQTGERRILIRSVVDQLPLRIRWEVEILKKLAHAPADLFERLTDNLALLVARAFAVQDDEVAILLVQDGQLMLRFAYPLTLYEGRTNMFPVDTRSIAGEVLRCMRGRIDNDVPRIEHLGVYERIRIKEDRPLEIQKMVSVPLIIPWGKVFGVVQVSRKGHSSDGAGSDFSSIDLVKLTDLTRWLAPHLCRVIPPDF